MRRKRFADSQKHVVHTTTVRIRFEECDPLGIVWHGNYIRYFEDGREAFGREHGISYIDQRNHGFATPIVHSACEHKLPLQYGDVATVNTYFENTTAAKMVFHYEIFNPEGELACTGTTIQVFQNLSGRSLLLNAPDIFLEWKRKMGLLDG